MWLTDKDGLRFHVNPNYIIKLEEYNGGTYITLVRGSCFARENIKDIVNEMLKERLNSIYGLSSVLYADTDSVKVNDSTRHFYNRFMEIM